MSSMGVEGDTHVTNILENDFAYSDVLQKYTSLFNP